MNSTLQALAQIPELVRYFVDLNLYKNELNTTNPLASDDNMMAKEFANFLGSLYSGKSSV
jgi:ubiquitin C-terminal hydrolase